MSAGVVALVLLAALLHASWNAMLKSSGDRFLALVLIGIGSGIGALPLAMLTPLPHPSAWPYIALSSALHSGYKIFLIRAYRIGDFGQSYPIARGSSPLLVSLGAALLAGEQMSGTTWLGVMLVSIGIISLANIKDRHKMSAPLAAFTTGVFIAAYTVTDGIGARTAGNALAYAGWLFVLDSLPLALFYLWQHKHLPMAPARRQNWLGLAGGIMSLLAYGIIIWAVTVAPMGTVSALRETSVLFATLIGTLFLGEKLTRRRLLAATLISTGAIVLGWH